jgi:hypothetical protein
MLKWSVNSPLVPVTAVFVPTRSINADVNEHTFDPVPHPTPGPTCPQAARRAEVVALLDSRRSEREAAREERRAAAGGGAAAASGTGAAALSAMAFWERFNAGVQGARRRRVW